MTEAQIKAVLSEDYRETTEETYDIYLLPPGEDPEACQSYLRMRNRDGKYNLMFEVGWQLRFSYVHPYAVLINNICHKTDFMCLHCMALLIQSSSSFLNHSHCYWFIFSW